MNVYKNHHVDWAKSGIIMFLEDIGFVSIVKDYYHCKNKYNKLIEFMYQPSFGFFLFIVNIFYSFSCTRIRELTLLYDFNATFESISSHTNLSVFRDNTPVEIVHITANIL